MLENITIFHVLHLEEHQEIFEHDFEGEEKVEQEGGAYWDQGMQNIEDDVADEVVEGDERREDVEGCSRNAVKSIFHRHWNIRINVPILLHVAVPVYCIYSLL